MMWNKVVSRSRIGALALFLALPGCTALSDCKYEVSQKIRTGQAWHNFDACQEECFTCDYRSGWKAGYYDVITGGTGCPPVIAPKKYWKPPVILEHDPCLRNEWYCGFQDGAACAKCQPDYHYLQTFMPGPVCCPTQTVSHTVVPSEPTHFPLEHIMAPPEPIEDAPAATPEMETPAAPQPEAEAPAPQPMPEAAQPPSVDGKQEEEYNKDPEPEPSNSKNTVPADFISRGFVQTKAESTSAGGSLLRQLVFNATQTPSQRAFNDEVSKD